MLCVESVSHKVLPLEISWEHSWSDHRKLEKTLSAEDIPPSRSMTLELSVEMQRPSSSELTMFIEKYGQLIKRLSVWHVKSAQHLQEERDVIASMQPSIPQLEFMYSCVFDPRLLTPAVTRVIFELCELGDAAKDLVQQCLRQQCAIELIDCAIEPQIIQYLQAASTLEIAIISKEPCDDFGLEAQLARQARSYARLLWDYFIGNKDTEAFVQLAMVDNTRTTRLNLMTLSREQSKRVCRSITRMTQLRELSLEDCDIEEEDLRLIRLPLLKSLTLSECPNVVPAQLATCDGLRGLRELWIDGIDECDPESCRRIVNSFSHLQKLTWGHQGIDEHCARMLSAHPSLTSLDLSSTKLPLDAEKRRNALLSLIKIPRLRHLFLRSRSKEITLDDVIWLERILTTETLPALESIDIADRRFRLLSVQKRRNSYLTAVIAILGCFSSQRSSFLALLPLELLEKILVDDFPADFLNRTTVELKRVFSLVLTNLSCIQEEEKKGGRVILLEREQDPWELVSHNQVQGWRRLSCR